ncbi:MAG TPA: 3-deoxy-D-manno-octulosonic acid transferase [Alphaproteobacteria bacterium]|nr:3-deoxy-D-manno-octulosonic acid transferase [Alphaproteobacteria bacterium]
MLLFTYRFLHYLLAPLLAVWMWVRKLKGREDPERYAERKGIATTPRPYGPLLWVHGASAGESASTLAVLEHLRALKPEVNLLLTTGTRSGMQILMARAPRLPGTGQTIIQYVPIDTPWATTRFINHWKPTISVFTESDFWPELLSKAPNPILLNGRISNRSWPKYKRYRWFFRPLISRFIHILAQRPVDVERLKYLGAKNVSIGGNLKFDAEPLPVDAHQQAKMQVAIGGRPTLVVASTHPGEEEEAAKLHLALRQAVPDLLTIVVPRHPHRGTQASNDLHRHVKFIHRRGIGQMPKKSGPTPTDIYVADTMGELGLWYRLAHVAVIGATLLKYGGHNPLEPLKLGTPTIAGPHFYNFDDMVPGLVDAGILTVSPTLPELAQTLRQWLTNPDLLNQIRGKIGSTMPAIGGASFTAATLLAEYIDKQPHA